MEHATQSSKKTGIIALVTALVYGVSPIDLIPDLIPLLGLSDDFVVIATLSLVAIKAFRARRTAVPVRREPLAPPRTEKPRFLL